MRPPAAALTPLVAADAHAPLVQFADRVQSAGAFLGAARALAARLPEARFVLNLCEDRYEFMLAFVAAMLRGQTSLLPPSRADGMLRELLANHAPAYALAGADCHFTGPGVHRIADLLGETGDHAAVDPDTARVDGDRLACIVFTSGSTGAPNPAPKTWAALWETGREIATRFGIGGTSGASDTVIGTVPPQHMFGLETTILTPLAAGAAVYAGRPLLAADVARAVARSSGRRWLMTTPLSLRACAAEPGFAPPLAGIVSATMPLEHALALDIETGWGAPVHEIYGCTEGGSLATRRVTRDAGWVPLDGIRVALNGETAEVSGGHLPAPVPLADVITVETPTRFVLHGRAANLVKVGGKRTTLEALDAELRAIAGVADGAFYLPDGAARPMAFVVAPGLDARAVRAALRDRIDAVFLPRPLRMVRALPRNDLGKLTRAALAALARESAGERP